MSTLHQRIDSLSILVPTHNRSDLLFQTLQSISQINVPKDISLEIVVAANACTDETEYICRTTAGKIPFPLHYVQEPKLGINHARNRLLAEASGDVLAFLDDDVYVDPDWLGGLVDFFSRYPADIVAGKIELWWKAVQKPSWMDSRIARLLSCTDFGASPRELFNSGEVVGANMAIHRRVLRKVPDFRTDMDRRGRQLSAGGDTEFADQALKTGCRIFYSPQAAVLHWVAPERITLNYLDNTALGIGIVRVQMNHQRYRKKRLKLLCEHTMRIFVYGILEMICGLLRWKRHSINYRIRRMTSRGMLRGLTATPQNGS
jgi:glucosyl-dolichyl phosphate glucuronosyltransferase